MGTVTKGKSYKYTLCTGHLDLIIVTIAMAKGCVLHYLSVIAVLSLSLLNQGWGVPKHYLVETQDGDNNVVGTQDDDAYVVGNETEEYDYWYGWKNMIREKRKIIKECNKIENCSWSERFESCRCTPSRRG